VIDLRPGDPLLLPFHQHWRYKQPAVSSAAFASLFAARPVLLAPMEEVTDPVFRALCRARGASVCFTEFVHVDHLLDGGTVERRKLALAPGDQPTAIQIYGADPACLAEAAAIAEAAGPAFVDINCGCWVPRVAARGAGAAWLRDPDAMVAMARMVVQRVSLPVTLKTRIGLGPESHMPIVDLARRLEDAGVAAITIHCRTAKMGHEGRADWRWAARAQAAVKIPVVVNGDIRSAGDARRALEETGCAGAMVGRRAIEHPWIFREARALLDTGVGLPKPTSGERIALCREHLERAVAVYGERAGVRRARRFLPAYVRPLPGGAVVGARLSGCEGLASAEEVLSEFEEALRMGAVEASARAPVVARRRGGEDEWEEWAG
jgi:nifR3 family TIM-barrel protein